MNTAHGVHTEEARSADSGVLEDRYRLVLDGNILLEIEWEEGFPVRADWSDHIWIGIIVLAVASIFSIVMSFSAQLVGAFLGGAALLAAIDIILDRIRHKGV